MESNLASRISRRTGLIGRGSAGAFSGPARSSCLGLLLVVLGSGRASAQNLLLNPGFEEGNQFFATDYNYTNPVCCQDLNPGDYTIIHDPSIWNAGLRSIEDHTVGGTQMLVADGIAGFKFWQQTISNLQPQTFYAFRFWWVSLDPNHVAQPTFRVELSPNGGGVWIPRLTVVAADTGGAWRSAECSFNTQTLTSVMLRIVDLQNAPDGNDFAIDDVELTTCLPPVVVPNSPAVLLRDRGQSMTLSVTASGFGELFYQWRRNGNPLTDGASPTGSIISGATTDTLTIRRLRPGDAGFYDCEVFSECDSTISRRWRLFISPF